MTSAGDMTRAAPALVNPSPAAPSIGNSRAGASDGTPVFTWASGIVGVPMPQYVLSMLIGRGKRVYVLAGGFRIGEARAEAALRRWIEPLGWVATALVVLLIGWLVWRAKFA